MDESCNRQLVRLEEIPTWAEDFSRNRVDLAKIVTSADNETRKRYPVDWDINSRVSLYEGDITCIEADAIVCCNNSSLKTTGGISTAIEQAAGEGLTEELATMNGCQTGEAKITAGYNLPVNYIVHTVGPKDKNEQLLDKCYESCLEQVKAKQMNSLVFCCVSTGDFARSPDRSERSFYEVRDGVLIRVWRNVLEPEGFGRTQVIVPISLRPKIIHVAHDVPSSGHLGTQKTLDRVLRHFYWPGIFKYVREYCRTCDVCQRLGKGATKALAPLINLPVIQSDEENEVQEVSLPDFVADVIDASDINAQLRVAEGCASVESTIESMNASECLNLEVDMDVCLGNFAVEAQELLLLREDRNSRDFSKLDMNVVSEMCLGDSQMVNDCKALLSMDSVMTTVVCDNISHTKFSNESSSNVAVMYMNVDCGERVILVSTVVLLQLFGQMINGLNDVFTQVVTIMPCTHRGQLLHESMDMFGSQVFLTEDCTLEVCKDECESCESTLKIESVVERYNCCLTDIVHKCDDMFLERNELLPDVFEDVVEDEFLNECRINEVHDTYDVSLDLTGISMEIVGIGCLESYLCAQVYLQNVFARMELLVGDECRLRRRLTRRGSKGVSAFVFLWMVLTVLVLSARDTSVTSCTAFYVFLPSEDRDVAWALVGLLAALRVFEVYRGFVPLVWYTDSRRKFGCGLQRCL